MKSGPICLSVAVLLYGCFSVLTIVDQANGYWARALPGIKCISRYPPGTKACAEGNCRFNEPDNVFQLACDTDCQSQHGATHGYCLESDICNCGPPVYSTGNFSLQCMNFEHAELFQTICDEDCRCTHNKIGGGCNFWTKACECGPTNTKPVLNCPYKTSNEYFLKLLERYAGIGIDVPSILA